MARAHRSAATDGATQELAPGRDEPSGASVPRTRASPARPLDAGSLRSGFCDLLGRPPFESERAYWLGKARHALCDALIGSEEFWSNWLEEQLYYFFLIDNFRPQTERISALPSELAAGRLDVREATHRIALSSSFDQRNPGADTFVTVVMEQLVGVKVQANPRELEIGKAIYDGASGVFLGRSGKRQADIVDIAVRHKAFAEVFVTREHRRLLGVDPPAKERAEWARRLHQSPGEHASIVRDWVLSEAWDSRVSTRLAMPNRLFARALHVDLLDEPASEEEARRIRSALDGMSDAGPLRAVLARMLIDSGRVKLPPKASIDDPRAWVGGLFRKLLGREASSGELDAFAAAFAEPACRPATVLCALVTHHEYQFY